MYNRIMRNFLVKGMNQDKRVDRNNIYRCDVWSGSSDLGNIKLWFLLLPFTSFFMGLPSRKIRVTLLRSPLGNKTSKDQFEKREHRYHYYIQSKDPAVFLAFLGLISQLQGVKYKIRGEIGRVRIKDKVFDGDR
uniref:ribosomal protein S10 n=1 Tax=Sporochnus bolleanus TaxID=461143 RepID=UPI002E78CDB5|nr:ribosomal protein S10 [Sporochnus bolleanus]WBP70354.1 ribosomal protein S10 [Sporochnus bolleanus]